MKWIIGSILLAFSGLPYADQSTPAPTGEEAIPTMPSAQDWLTHIEHGIAPYYMQPAALGKPLGHFPSFRCNDGSVVDLAKPCPELSADWVKDKLGRQYTRMLSRQIYTYGVIFHMTGDKAALAAAKSGVDYLRLTLLDKTQGGAITYLDRQGKVGLKASQRTSQDLAYAQLGMAFYYYLTRDQALLEDIIALKNYIFSHYYSKEHQQLLWVLEDSDEQSHQQLELVAQLDQINAYMLLLIPLLPEAEAARWKRDLYSLTQILFTHYHDAKQQRFYGYIHHPSGKPESARHGDRGHTIKSYWMIYLSAIALADDAMQAKAEQGLRAVLKRAYAQYPLYEVMTDTRDLDPDMQVGFWNSRENQLGSAWWEHAELDQAAETLALSDPSMEKYLRYTYSTWLTAMVDPQYGGIWPYAFASDSAKLHHWKNGYHGAEHALIAYLGAAQRQGQVADLYFSLDKQQPASFKPYYYRAKQLAVTEDAGIQKVSFKTIY